MKLLILAALLFASPAMSQVSLGFTASHTQSRTLTPFTLCAYGDSHTNGGDWFAPLERAGVNVIDIGSGGARATRASTASIDGEEAIVQVTGTCDVGAVSDMFGSGSEAQCIVDIQANPRCDMVFVMYGTNNAGSNYIVWRDSDVAAGYRTAMNNILTEIVSEGLPIVVATPPRRLDSITKDEIIRNFLIPAIRSAVTDSGGTDTYVAELYQHFDNYEAKSSFDAMLNLYANVTTFVLSEYQKDPIEDVTYLTTCPLSGDCVHMEAFDANVDGLIGQEFMGAYLLGEVSKFRWATE